MWLFCGANGVQRRHGRDENLQGGDLWPSPGNQQFCNQNFLSSWTDITDSNVVWKILSFGVEVIQKLNYDHSDDVDDYKDDGDGDDDILR